LLTDTIGGMMKEAMESFGNIKQEKKT